MVPVEVSLINNSRTLRKSTTRKLLLVAVSILLTFLYLTNFRFITNSPLVPFDEIFNSSVFIDYAHESHSIAPYEYIIRVIVDRQDASQQLDELVGGEVANHQGTTLSDEIMQVNYDDSYIILIKAPNEHRIKIKSIQLQGDALILFSEVAYEFDIGDMMFSEGSTVISLSRHTISQKPVRIVLTRDTLIGHQVVASYQFS